MKARVKATGEIVEVQPIYVSDEYKTDKGVYYDILEIELLDEYSPDYWTRLEHQYAGMAMQGMLANENLYQWVRTRNYKSLVENAELLANSLVEKMKENEKAMH